MNLTRPTYLNNEKRTRLSVFLRVKMAVVLVKRQVAVQTNIKHILMTTMTMTTNLFISSQVHVLAGKNDVKQ